MIDTKILNEVKATCESLLAELEKGINNPPSSSLAGFVAQYKDDTVPLLKAVRDLSDSVCSNLVALEKRIATLEAHNHDAAYAPITHGHG